MYDRCISSCSSTGSMRSRSIGVSVTDVSFVLSEVELRRAGESVWRGHEVWLRVRIDRPPVDSDVEEADVLGVPLDERATLIDVLAHEDREDLVGHRGVGQCDLAQQTALRIHRGLPQFAGVHLAQTLVPLDRRLLRKAVARRQT